MKSFTHYTIAAEHDGLSIETYLKQVLHISGRRLQKLTRQKGICVGGKPAFLKRPLKAGDRLRILTLEDAGYGVEPEADTISILYEDDDVLVVDKPAGLLVHPSGQTSSGTLANYLAGNLADRNIRCTIRPLHRLDRDTSGCVLFAKHAAGQTKLEAQLKDHTLARRYLALTTVAPLPADGCIDAPIGAHPTRPNRRAIRSGGDAALTHYETCETYAAGALLSLSLATGRTHQIRVHLAHIGSPLLGDAMYGKRSPLISRQALHACSLRFTHPVSGREVSVESPLPPDFQAAIEKLKNAGNGSAAERS